MTDTLTESPAAALMNRLRSALTGILKAPFIDPIVVEKVCPLIVTSTVGRLPALSAVTTSRGTVMPVAVLPSRSRVASNSMRHI